MITQMLVLIRFTIFTWEVCFKKIKHVYNVVVKSIIIYDNNIWHAFHERLDIVTTLINKFNDLQKQRFKMMSDVFWITLNQLFDVETQIQFIKLHFAFLQIKTRIRLQEKTHNALIVEHCNKIKRKLTQSKNRRRRLNDITSKERKYFWFKNLCAEINDTKHDDHTSIDKELKKLLHKK
jgi:hypothetical protein